MEMFEGGIFVRKFTKRAVSLAVASFVTVTSVFAGSSINANAATTSILATTTKNDTYKVTFTAPSSWTGTVYAYAYYDVTSANGTITQEEPLGYWPGTKATKVSGNTYSATVPTSVGSANVIFASITGTVGTEAKEGKRENADGTTTVTHYYESTTEAQLPLDGEGGFVVNSDADISSTGVVTKVTPAVTPTTEPTKTPKVTSTPKVTKEPTAAPTVTPVSGPQVTVSEPNGTSYYEETNDTLSVIVDLAEGATSATYSVDNGPETTITGKTIVTLGEGKIANSEINLKVTSTDGTTTNTQEFTYFKKSQASESSTKTSKKSVSASMVSLFSTVKSFASATVNKNLPVHFKIPASDWEGSDRTVYCYAYYDVTTSYGTETIKPLGIWPGTAMTKNGAYYDVKIPTTVGSVKVMFSCVIGGKGQPYYKGDLLPDGTRCSEEHYSCNVLYKLPYGYSGTDEFGNAIPYNGLQVTDETWITVDGYDTNNLYSEKTTPVTPIPSTASPTPTVTSSTKPGDGTETPDPSASPALSTELNGYFGASLSAPQYNTTSQTLSAVALNATGDVTYAFSVDGKEVYSGSNSVIDWDTTKLTAGTHEISAKITDSKGNVWSETKNYTIAVDGSVVEPTATPEVTVEPTVEPTATPEVTVEPTVEPTATPEVTVEPTTVPTVAPTAVATAVPTTQPAINIDNSGSQNPSNSVSGGAVTSAGSIAISFSKKNKTAGETIKVKAKVSGVDEVYKLSYAVKKTGGKTKTLAKKVNKKTVSWTPTAKGTYTVTVKAYSEDGKVLATGTTKYKVKKRVITISSIKPASTKVGKVTTIKIKGKTTKGKLKIKVVIKNKKGKTVKTKKYSKKKTFTWKPTKKGTYTMKVTAKNGKGVVVSKTKKIKVKK